MSRELLALETQLKEAGIAWRRSQTADGEVFRLIAELGSGRHTRKVPIAGRWADVLGGVDLSRVAMLDGFVAYADYSEDVIEAALATTTPSPLISVMRKIPGTAPDEELDWTDSELVVADGERTIRLGRPSDLANALLYGPVRHLTIRLTGFGVTTHDSAVDLVTSYAQSFLFDLDVRYGVGLSIPRPRRSIRVQPIDPVRRPPTFPSNAYATEAAALYRYGRQAHGLPLLEFLAYYQALEFFFPSFALSETASRIRTHIQHPRFDASDDREIARLIQLSRPAVQGGASERDQLRSTVRATTSHEELRDFILQIEEQVGEHFTARTSPLKGVAKLDMKADLRDQVADRVYTIRCRVVHTKSDGAGTQTELLLPTSAEAEALAADNVLLRYLAQQSIIAKATPL